MQKQLIQSGIIVILARVIGTIIAFSLSIVVARVLGAAGYGAYTYMLSLIMLLSIPIQAGFPTLAVRETSKALANGNIGIIKGIWFWLFRLSFIYFATLCILLIVFSYLGITGGNSLRYELFLYGFVVIIFGSLIATQSAIIRGLGSVILGVVPEGLIRPAVSLVIVLSTLMVHHSTKITPIDVMIIHVASVTIALVFSLVVLIIFIKKYTLANSNHPVVLANWKNALYSLTIVGGVQLLFGYADVIILGLYRDDVEVGIYKVAVQFSTLVVFGLTVLNQMLQPHFSRLFAENDMIGLQKLVTLSSRAILILATVPSVIFIIGGESVINFAYGKEYISGVLSLNILVVGQLLNAAFGSVGALLNMTGHEKDSMKGMLIALFVNISLSLIIVPLLGMEGAAISTALSLIVWNILLRHYVKKRINIESSGLIPVTTRKGKIL